MNRRLLAIGSAAVVALTGVASTAWAGGSTTTPVTVSTTLGTRTLNLLDLTGQPIGASGLTIGTGHGGNMVVNVTDSLYQHVGYQVSAMMSDLYPYANGAYNFNTGKIASSAVSVSYPSNLLDLSNLGNLLSPVYTLTGTLPLGLGTLTNTTVTGTAQSVQTLTGDIVNGALAALPIKVQTGTSGAFTSPAQLSAAGAPTVSSAATQLNVMTGTAQAGDLSGALAALKATIGNTTNAVPVQTLITNGYLDQSQVLAAVAQATGQLNLVMNNASAVLSALSANLTSIGTLIGQSGSYNSLPQLAVAIPSGTASGTYRGELTVTLADLP
jgi:hypothetical protein